MKWKPFELAVLNSLYRIERRQEKILEGVTELLKEGPNDQTLPSSIRAFMDNLAKESAELQSAVEANKPNPTVKGENNVTTT